MNDTRIGIVGELNAVNNIVGELNNKNDIVGELNTTNVITGKLTVANSFIKWLKPKVENNTLIYPKEIPVNVEDGVLNL